MAKTTLSPEDQSSALSQLRAGVKPKEVAKHFGVPDHIIYNLRKQHGLVSPRGKRVTPSKEATLASFSASLKTAAQQLVQRYDAMQQELNDRREEVAAARLLVEQYAEPKPEPSAEEAAS